MVIPQAKVMERRIATASVISRPTEARKPGRRLVRPPLERTEEPHTDTEMPAAEAGAGTDEVKTGTTSHEPEVPQAGTSLSRKRGPSSEPRRESGTQASLDSSNTASPPPQKKQKETAVSQDATQDTTESTPVPAVPAAPASPEIREVTPEPVVPADNVDAPPVNAEEMDADQPGGEEIIEATGEEDLTEVEGKNQDEEEQQLETDATLIGLEEGEAEQNPPSEGEDDREEGELPEEPDQPPEDESNPSPADEMEETLELVSPEPGVEAGEITEERSEGAEIADVGAKSNEEAPAVVAPVIQKRIVRLSRGSSSSSVRESSESAVASGTTAAENQGSGTPSADTEASEGASRGGRTIRFSQRTRGNAPLTQAGSSQPPTARGRGQSPASTRV